MKLLEGRLINVSNRLPVEIKFRAGRPRLNPSAGGLASALDSNDFSCCLDAAQPGDSGTTRRNVIAAGHFQAWFVLAVPISNTNGQSDMDALATALRRLVGELLCHNPRPRTGKSLSENNK